MSPGPIYAGRIALIVTGRAATAGGAGTAGDGVALAIAEVFAQHGAQLVITYPGGAPGGEDAIRKRIIACGAPAPLLIAADDASATDAAGVLQQIHERFGRLDAFIHQVAAAPARMDDSLDEFTEEAFLANLRRGAWPTVAWLRAMKAVLGRYPRYVVSLAPTPADHFASGGEFAAMNTALVQTLTRQLASRLRPHDVRMNVVCSRALRASAGHTAVAGGIDPGFAEFQSDLLPDDWFMQPEEIGKVIFALCSGLFDGVSGQAIMVDRGNTFADGISYLYERREDLGL